MNRSDVEDAWDIFGKHVAMQLKVLSEEECIIAQDKIQQVLTRSRLNDFAKKSGHSVATFNQTDSLPQLNNSPRSSVDGTYFATPVVSPLSPEPIHYQEPGCSNQLSNLASDGINYSSSKPPIPQGQNFDILAQALSSITQNNIF